MSDVLQVKCEYCNEQTQEPYIECCDCDANLCMSCFSTGLEVRNHKNDHRYSVRRNDFPLFDNCNWSAKEECKLLSALSTYGYGNWEEISKTVHSRSKLECQEHYKKYYIDNVQFKELDILPHTEQSMFPKPLIPYLYSMEVRRDPPRNNHADQQLAGYNAYRSEFEHSYDHNAENIFNIENNYSDEENDEDPCIDALKVSLVNALNNRLKERHRRYNIIANHALLMPNKLLSWVQKFEKTIVRQKAERLLAFMQFMTGMQFDAFMESLSLETELLQRITRLSEYRRLGIKTLYGSSLYKSLKKEHEAVIKEQKHATSVMVAKFSNQSPTKNKIYFTKDGQIRKHKKAVVPLDIIDLPGYNMLSDSEKELCSRVRLIPENYLDMKAILIAENNRLGILRLLDARRVLKIDVNKTRKVYDFLAFEGFLKTWKAQ